MTNSPHDDDEALDPAAMLALANAQQRSVASQINSFAWIITGVWGIAWLVGFGAIWLIDGLAPAFALPAGVAWPTLGVCLAVAVATSIVLGIRSTRGVKSSPSSAFTGAVYGSTWSISMVGIWILGSSMIAQGMSAEIAAFYFTSAFVLMTGVMMLVSAAIWQTRPSLYVGIWLVVIAAVAPLFGVPGNYLFLALSGGLVFLLFSIVLLVHASRLRRRLQGSDRA
ncbi:hypothetical protein SAMN04489806_2234 [Paramicrobacterium humi]|uniref:Uncharacterized protein n=1 Tax=Paramicrobacterium humi TaxID=640635 RepID=A0A1H4NN91_9MICO|nr:hypothetical protein [Microbacterium humi]SEB96032.1 hypothetical protein SAMN04489806_2234 [Microbacterium humi]